MSPVGELAKIVCRSGFLRLFGLSEMSDFELVDKIWQFATSLTEKMLINERKCIIVASVSKNVLTFVRVFFIVLD